MPVLAAANRERDIVFVDFRGTGGSGALDCDLSLAPLGVFMPPEIIAACRQEWASHADLRHYTTRTSLADLDEVRAALGYKEIDVFGGSYGTRAALTYLNLYPDHVRTLVLRGIAPRSYIVPERTADYAQMALDRIFAECAADTRCQSAFPHLREEFRRLSATLREQPVRLTVFVEGKARPVTFDERALILATHLHLYFYRGAAMLPALIHEAATGNVRPLARALLEIRQRMQGLISVGAHLAVLCSEDLPFARRDQAATGDAFEGAYWFDQYEPACRAMQLPPAGSYAELHRDPQSSKPVLMVSGSRDPVTPASEAQRAAQLLPNTRHVILKNASHAFDGTEECTNRMVGQFLVAASGKGVDAACAEQIPPAPFPTSLP